MSHSSLRWFFTFVRSKSIVYLGVSPLFLVERIVYLNKKFGSRLDIYMVAKHMYYIVYFNKPVILY